MSIVNRLKSLFKGDKEESDVNNDVSNTSDDVQVTSSKKVSVNISKGEKEVSIEKTETVTESGDKTVDLTFKKDIKPVEDEAAEEAVEDSSEEIVEEVEVAEETEAPVEVEEVAEETETVDEDEDAPEEDVEEVEEKTNDKERDKMTLLTDKELLTDANRDPDFTAEFIDAGIETVQHCFQCGTCSGSCPSGRRTPYKVRQIVRKCLLGLKEEVITDDALWMCTTCYTCQERCLRSVKIVEIIKKARNIAAHAGYMAKPHKMTGVFVMNTGHGVPINDATKALRTKIGLSEIPPTTHAFPEALAEVQKICKITGFDELIGYDEETGGLKE
ncbi:MAG: CoB--CoM heterodisulfide reductase subunit C [Methanobrevibacter thaueri]|jgi:heterodisulfide reductase subunit C|uniref:CoB--CoM heterodisulfide reductase subunit C n=1 Tax=Methanobrevibacter thaueri TaxID=190975 RepID=UPI0026EA562A|nr:CoB--CoM heterodisulfide reductase subunit C [Methanobrevibacter thaueri]MBE6495548.1 CoB--CoM heterodisulfide reductase subunit C [Methanobrevibacter thaueri]